MVKYMQVFLIEEKESPSFWKNFFKVIEIIDDKIILNFEISKCKFNKKAQLSMKIREILDLNLSNMIILSNKLKQNKDFVNLLYSKDINIVQGRFLFKLLIEKIVDKICIKNKIIKEQSKIGIIINYASNIMLEKIENLAKNFKILNIVTNNINKFRLLQKKLLEEEGIIINITNNKKKALLNSDIILNVDFPEETLNRYVINSNSILINLEENIKLNKKIKIINDFDVELKKGTKIEEDLVKDIYKNYDLKDLLEIYLINNPIEKDNVEVEQIE